MKVLKQSRPLVGKGGCFSIFHVFCGLGDNVNMSTITDDFST